MNKCRDEDRWSRRTGPQCMHAAGSTATPLKWHRTCGPAHPEAAAARPPCCAAASCCAACLLPPLLLPPAAAWPAWRRRRPPPPPPPARAPPPRLPASFLSSPWSVLSPHRVFSARELGQCRAAGDASVGAPWAALRDASRIGVGHRSANICKRDGCGPLARAS